MAEIKNLPDPGENRFWVGIHQPRNTKQPLLLQLREKLAAGSKPNVSLSTLITQQGTIADEKAIVETAEQMLIRAGRVDQFVGVLNEGS